MTSKRKLLPIEERVSNAWKVEKGSVQEYVPAVAPEFNLVNKMMMTVAQVFGMLKILVLTIFICLKATYRVIVPATPKSIKGQLALVTGGANGLGKAISTKLAQCGAKVAIVDLDVKAANATAQELCEMTGNKNAAKAFSADISSLEDVKNLHDEIAKKFGAPVDIIVNNAGLMPPVSLLNGSDADINRILDVNLKSHFWMLRTFLPTMKKRNSGNIVVVSSLAGLVPFSRAVAYTATKYGLRGMCLALHDELTDEGVDGVHVTIAYPYFMLTRKELIDNITLSIPAIRPEDAAATIVGAMRRNILQIGAPTYMTYFGTIISTLPHEIYQIWRKTFRTEVIS